MNTRACFASCLLSTVLWSATTSAADFPQSFNVELQPLKSQVKRVVEAMDYLGFPLTAADRKELDAAIAEEHQATSREGIQKVLDRYALYGVHINPEMRVKVSQGPAKAILHEQGWVQFLVKVHNESGTTAELKAVSPQAIILCGGKGRTPSSADGRPPEAPHPHQGTAAAQGGPRFRQYQRAAAKRPWPQKLNLSQNGGPTRSAFGTLAATTALGVARRQAWCEG